MFIKKIFFTCLILTIAINSFSQTKNYKYYFDKDLNTTDQVKSIFYGVGMYENDLFELRLFNTLSKKLLLIEHFTDSSLKVFDGFFVSYYENTAKEWEGIYSQGKEDGLWKKYDKDGRTIDSSIYNNGEEIIDANFIYNFPNPGMVVLTIDSLKTGKITEIHFDESGKIVSKENVQVHEDPDKIFTKTEVEASFPGGLPAWQSYITNLIERHIREFNKDDYGTCVINFIVDTLGNVSDIVAKSGCGKHLSKVGISAIKNGPKWIPAQQNGRKVKAYRIQTITLQNPGQ